MSTNPNMAVAGAATNYVLRYQAKGGFTNQTIRFGIPDGFTTPVIGGSTAGNIAVLKGTCTVPNQPYLASGPSGATWIGLDAVSCPKGGNFVQLGYNTATATLAKTYTFPGFVANSPADPATVVVSPAAAAQSNFAFSQTTADRYAGTDLTPIPQVSVFDVWGNPITGGDVTLALLRTSAPAGPVSFDAGDTTQPPVAGTASFPGMKVNTAGVYTLRATRGALSTDSPAFTINPAAASQLAVGHIADAAAGSILGVKVTIEDAFGNVEANDNTTVVSAAIKAPNTPGGTLSGTTSQQAVSGIATFPNLSINRQGVYTLTASAGSLTGDSNAFTINAVVTRPLTGAGNWAGTYGTTEWWLFEYGVDPAGSPYVPPNLQFATDGVGATMGDLTSSGASGWSYSANTSDDRALQNPCFNPPANCGGAGIDPSFNRASGALFSTTSFSNVLQFANAFTGKLTVYAVDWDNQSRNQSVTVHDALGDQTVALSSFTGGAYATFNITTGNASNVTVTTTNTSGPNAVIAGMFLN